MPLKCFFLTSAEAVNLYLRRYNSDDVPCPSAVTDYRYHQSLMFYKRIPLVRTERASLPHAPHVPFDHPLWPKHCQCGYEFMPDDTWQVFQEEIFARSDNGEETELRSAPPGAMWYADWNPECWRGADGHSLTVKCPDGTPWLIDGPANNCTKPADREHRCWIRTGTPPNITVGKNGNTCSAGAGSIQARSYHGFLRDGCFT